MLKIAHHKAYAHALPEGHRFPMLKYELIPEQLLYEGIVDKESLFEPVLADLETVALCHDIDYVHRLFELGLDAKMIRRIGFPLSQELVDRERLIIDGTVKSALYALEHGVSFNSAGGTHHAGFDFGEGFCLLNDQAVATTYLLKNNLVERVLIVDLDVHQGNGTAHIFEQHKLDRGMVFTFSMHGDKNFPFVKERSSLDIPLPDGIADDLYLNILQQELTQVMETFKPDFVFYQAGVDVLHTDKLGKLKLTAAGCRHRDEFVIQSCYDRGLPLQISMGGGYSVHIKDIVNAHVETYKAAISIYGY